MDQFILPLTAIFPFILTVFWIVVLFTYVRGKTSRTVLLLTGVLLVALDIILRVSARKMLLVGQGTGNGFSTYLLETRFYEEQLTRLAQYFFASAIAALVLWLLLMLFLRFSPRVFYDSTEAGMLALGALVSGWPAVFIFLAVVFLLVACAAVVHILFSRRTLRDRFVIGPMVPVAAIVAMWLGNTLVQLTGLDAIRF